jgi:hypothetical protein
MANHKKYRIKLTEDERSVFREITKGRRGRQNIAVWKVQRANVMLKCDESEGSPAWTDEELSEAFGATTRSIENWRKKAVEEGPLSVLERKKRMSPPTPPILDGDGEAQLAKLACSTPANGRNRWTLRLLAEQLVELNIVETISRETVRRAMKKTN